MSLFASRLTVSMIEREEARDRARALPPVPLPPEPDASELSVLQQIALLQVRRTVVARLRDEVQSPPGLADYHVLSTKRREQIYDACRGNAEFPCCNICGLAITTGQKWDVSHDPTKPRWLGGDVTGLAHRRCNRLHNNQHDTPLFHKNNRQRQKHIGAYRPRQIMPGSKLDSRKRKMDGTAVDRITGAPLQRRSWIKHLRSEPGAHNV